MEMYEVDMEIGGSREGYWALLRFEDRRGRPHRKEIRGEREADKNSNLLQAAVEAFRALQVACVVNLFTDSGYIINPLSRGWLAKWEANGWRNSSGKQVKYAGQWQQLSQAAAGHRVEVREGSITE